MVEKSESGKMNIHFYMSNKAPKKWKRLEVFDSEGLEKLLSRKARKLGTQLSLGGYTKL